MISTNSVYLLLRHFSSLALCMTLLLISGCQSEPEVSIRELTIITANAPRLAGWYADNLNFTADEFHEKLTHESLIIHLNEESKAISEDSLKKIFQVDLVPGFFKFGFCTSHFAELQEHFQEHHVPFEGTPYFDPKLKRQTFIVKDPDGNRLQFFNDDEAPDLKPYFFSLIVESIGESEKWYQVKMPIEDTYNLDEPSKNTYSRLLQGNGLVLELIQGPDHAVKSKIDYSHVIGFHHVEIEGVLGSFKADREGNEVLQSPTMEY